MKVTMMLEVEKNVLEWCNRVLVGQRLEDAGREEILKTFTAKFGDGFEADLKVCNGDPPFLDAVLFRDGHEVAVIEPTDRLDGKHVFDEDHVVVVVERKVY